MIKHALAVALLTNAIVLPAAAEELKKLPAALDPDKAYVLVELEAFNGAKQASDLLLARYDPEKRDLHFDGDGKPQREIAHKGFSKDRERRSRLHLLEVDPGLYVVEGANDTSFSLGSRTFTAAAGEVVDLGVIRGQTDFMDGEEAEGFGVGEVLKAAFLGPFFSPKVEPRATFLTARDRGAEDSAIPPVLAARTKPVVWGPADATFGNHLGGLINRFGGRAERKNAASVNDEVDKGTTEPNREPTD